jgi:hypothetical protein
MDKRKNNGGNSTKAKGIDKRKNKYIQLLDKASDENDIISVIKKLKTEAIKGDIQAIKLFLEYYLGKPTEKVDHTSNGERMDNVTNVYLGTGIKPDEATD